MRSQGAVTNADVMVEREIMMEATNVIFLQPNSETNGPSGGPVKHHRKPNMLKITAVKTEDASCSRKKDENMIPKHCPTVSTITCIDKTLKQLPLIIHLFVFTIFKIY